jgi:hypothetical protein
MMIKGATAQGRRIPIPLQKPKGREFFAVNKIFNS